jgi:hypothetical protein
MAVSAKAYGVPIKNQLTGANPIDFDSDVIKCALTTSAYTPNQDTHDFFNDITNEITGTGYTAGGVTLTSVVLTYDTASNEIRIDADDAEWTSASFTARYAVIYEEEATAATSPLIAYIDFGGDQTVASGTFRIVFDTAGFLKYTVA